MQTEEFERELSQISQMIGTWKTDELFLSCYEDLLARVRNEPDPSVKHYRAERMQKLCLKQCEWLMNQWLIAKREHDFYQL